MLAPSGGDAAAEDAKEARRLAKRAQASAPKPMVNARHRAQVMRASKLYEAISHAWFVFLNDG